MPHALLADLVLSLHVGFVLFVVLGLVLTLVGGARGWSWVRNRRFRFGHLLAIGIVVAQAWLGVICPLTSLEMGLREAGGESTYQGSFITHWLGELLYIDGPPWMFTAAYTAFGLLVAWSWRLVPPAPRRPSREDRGRP